MSLRGIAVCRLLNGQKREPGSVRGIFCQLCKRELQVTRSTATKIEAGELAPLCNVCGYSMASALSATGSELLPIATPTALQSLGSPRIDAKSVDFMRRIGAFRCAHCGEAVSVEEAPTHTCPRQA